MYFSFRGIFISLHRLHPLARLMKKTPATQNTQKYVLLIVLAAICIITYLAFSTVFKNEFTNWDDNAYVFQNPHLTKKLTEAISYFFGQHYFVGNYIPVTMIAYSLQRHAAGLDPAFYHTVNLLLHMANVLLVFWFIYLLSNKKIRVAAFVALLFGIHPMHVESVAWIAELKDVLYTFFFLSGLILYQKYVSQKLKPEPTQKPLLLLTGVFVLFVLSALSKPAALIFPLVLLLIDFYMYRPLKLKTWLEKIPFLVVSLVLGYVAILAQQSDKLLHNDYSWFQRVLFASHSLITYLWKFFVPVQLSNFYPYPDAKTGIPSFYYLTPLVLLAITYLLYKSAKQSRLYVFGALFFFVNLLLVLQFISVGDAIMAERYTYVSYIGLLFIVGMLADKLWESGKYRNGIITLGVAVILLSSLLTHSRTKVWRNDDSIATDLLAKYPNDRLALNNKGFILLNQGRFQESINLFEKALVLKPDYTRASINLLNAQLELRQTDNALNTANKALTLEPANFNLLYARARILLLMNKNEEAIIAYRKCLAQDKSAIKVYIDLCQCYYNLANYAEAVGVIDEALLIAPQDYVLLNNKGYMLFSQKKYREALELFKASLAINPEYSTAQVNLKDCENALALKNSNAPELYKN